MVAGGSSPLTRGNHSQKNIPSIFPRFIPAYAGESSVLGGINNGKTVHPRLRGEIIIRVGQISSAGGSSPLTRGNQKLQTPEIRQFRFIPAYAGKSVMTQTPKQGHSVHPRLRGEIR